MSLSLFCIQGYHYRLSKFHIYVLVCCNGLSFLTMRQNLIKNFRKFFQIENVSCTKRQRQTLLLGAHLKSSQTHLPRPPPLAEEPPPSVSASRQTSPQHGINLLTVNRSQLKRDSTKRASLIKPCLHERSSYSTAIPAHHLFLCTASLSWAWAVPGWPSLSCVLSPTRMGILRSVLGTKRT